MLKNRYLFILAPHGIPMCGRYTLTATQHELINDFALDTPFVYRPRYNIAPSQTVPAIRTAGQLDFLKWGFIAHWQNDSATGFINARSETIHEKPVFKKAFLRQRCLIPASGYIEWKSVGNKKQPIYFTLPDNNLFAFAGVWDKHASFQGSPLESCAILTQTAQQHADVHQRMPVIIPKEKQELWLSQQNSAADMLALIIEQTQQIKLIAKPISTLINNPKNDIADCLSAL